MNLTLGLGLAFLVTVLATPLVKNLAIKLGAVDLPNNRKVHQNIMPRLGGLAIFIGFFISFFLFLPLNQVSIGLMLGSIIIVTFGMLDDVYGLPAMAKVAGQLLAAVTVILFGIQMEFVFVPFILADNWTLGWLAIPFTLLWLVGITNAVNLIDGLDGLAAGVSAIATIVMLIMAIMKGEQFVAIYCVILLGAIIGFLLFNFYPAKIFMGDTGSLFLGFNLAAISILGFKQITLALIFPILILGVPIYDTFCAIVRRLINKQPIAVADKNHLHHCLLRLGFSHRTTVLIIYGLSIFFGVMALILTQTGLWIFIIVVSLLAVSLQIIAEMLGLLHTKEQPVLSVIKKVKLKRR